MHTSFALHKHNFKINVEGGSSESVAGVAGGGQLSFVSCFCRCTILALLISQLSCYIEWMDECGLELKHPYNLEFSQLSAAVVMPCTFGIGY